LDSCKKIFEDRLVPAKIAHGGGRRALVFILCRFRENGEVSGNARGGWRVSQIRGDDPVMLKDEGAFGPGNLNAARVAGIGGSGSVKNAERSAGKLERGDGRVFGFDFVKQIGSACLHANEV